MTIFKLLAITAAILVCGSIDGKAQSRGGGGGGTTDCSSGVVKIDAGSLRPAVVGLSLARGAVSIVEFPADDGVYYVHEGNSKFAAVFDSPTKATDRFVTVYPAAEFRLDAKTTAQAPSPPGATVTLQMRSGLIVVLEYSAVEDIRRNSGRCVLSYEVTAIAEARKEMGLGNVGVAAAAKTLPKASQAAVPSKVRSEDQPKEDAGKYWADNARKMIDDCFRSASVQCVENWTTPKNGLSIGTSRAVQMDGDKRMLIVGVRNGAGVPMRLAPGYPGLRIETQDPKGRTLESAAVKTEQVFFLFPGGEIPAGGTAYFAIVYKSPAAIGVRQRLTAIAAHRDAADEPATVAVPR